MPRSRCSLLLSLLIVLMVDPGLFGPVSAQPGAADPLALPLSDRVRDLLLEEVSGQMAFNNLIRLAGAPWVRERAELTGETSFYESDLLHRMVQRYGISTVTLERWEAPGRFEYPLAGELWITAPERRLIARIGADAALVARGSRSSDLEGELLYVPAMSADQTRTWLASRPTDRLSGRVALMWSHPRADIGRLLDEAGITAVISYASRDRYLDPDQVVYGSGPYGEGRNLRLGLSVSWRQWSEMLEDLERGLTVRVRATATVETYPDRYETVVARIPGTEPEAPGVIFTAHLFEGYLKRGTNDNMGGPAVQLEILRALHTLIERGELPRPRRTIWFLWPQEISGTYEFIKRTPGLAERMSININMDMISEGLRLNNSVFTMSETPAFLSSYLDGLSHAVLNYVWRTNDIVYLPDSPRGRPGGQYFPRPIWEKNGSRDAFRFYIHETTGGSDHICFNNPTVGVPAIEFFTWPDQWYHADTDLPDKGDPTEMKRVAFIGAATAWTAADCHDEVLPELLDAVNVFGHRRMAERTLPAAWRLIADADGPALVEATWQALTLVSAGVARERDAIRSTGQIATGSPLAAVLIGQHAGAWDIYERALRESVLAQAAERARVVGVSAPRAPSISRAERQWAGVVPAYHPEVRGREFNFARYQPAQRYLSENPEALTRSGLSRTEMRAIEQFIDGRRSVLEIRDRAGAVTGTRPAIEQVGRYLEALVEAEWIVMQQR